MTRTMKLAALVLLVAALAAACGGREAPSASPAGTSSESTTGAAKSAVVAASPTEAADVETSPTEAVDAEPVDTPAGPQASEDGEDLSVSDRQAGLENLDSYKANWTLEWKSTSAEEAQDVTWQWLYEFTRDPLASHSRWESVDRAKDENPQSMENWQIGNTSYIVGTNTDGEKTCISSSSEDNKVDESFTGPQTLGSVSDAKLVGTDTVNGIKTKHYRYDEKSIALFGVGKVSGDIWVADDGGYVVKDAATWEGGLFGISNDDETTGSGSWNWELTEINTAFEITPPEGCESASDSMPILADATEKMTLGDSLMYTTKTAMADVVKFYREEMKKAGWTEEGDAMISDETSSLNFKKDSETAFLMVSKGDEGTTVVLNIQKGE